MTSHIRILAGVVATLMVVAGIAGGPGSDALRAQNRRIDSDAKRTSDATIAFSEIMSAAQLSIAPAVLENAKGIAVFPGQPPMPRRRGQGPNTLRTTRLLDIRGRGILSVRGEGGNWSAPAFLELKGGSFPQDADLVLVIVHQRGLENVMRFEFEIDEEAAVAPGPLAGDLQPWTFVQQHADIFSYSRSRGVLSGVSLDGSAVQPDTPANQRFYGKFLTTSAAVAQTSGPEPVAAWRAALEKHITDARR